MVGRFDRSQAATHVFYQRDLKRRSNVASTYAEATLRGSYDDQKVDALLLGAYSLDRI
jgi:hypothetical protein